MPRKVRRKRHTKPKAFEDLNISELEAHRQRGGTLTPPLATLSNLSAASWKDAGLNEVLWAAILCGNLERQVCLDIFRHLLSNARSSLPNRQDTFITHSVLSVLANAVFDVIFGPVLRDTSAKEMLRSLLLIDCLPDRQHWLRHLDAPDPEINSVFLTKAIATCLDHQSQQSTDIRWLKVCYFAIVCDRARFAREMHEMVEGVRLYPDYGDQRKVRPPIRAFEIGLRMVQDGSHVPQEIPPALASTVPPAWSEEFWKECFVKTPCSPVVPPTAPPLNVDEYLSELFEFYNGLCDHFLRTSESTDIDARHDATFGITLFAINLAIGAGRGNVHRRAEGRLILRTIVEGYLTLKFLEKKDDATIWLQFRNYGVGQSKLALLKNLRAEQMPDFISLDDLLQYANEDMWQEFLPINLKSWAERNLRTMAAESGVKETYDKYYDWSSGYVHGHWGAIRDSVFAVCLNPLHRYHRIPFLPRLDMPSVLPDGARILNLRLDVVPPQGRPPMLPKLRSAGQASAKSRDAYHSCCED